MRSPAPALLLALTAGLAGCPGTASSPDGGSPGGDVPQYEASAPLADWPPGLEAGLPTGTPNVSPPASSLKLVFIHHSVGEDWGRPDKGDLRAQLNQNKYYMTDTNYQWGPKDAEASDGSIGDHTDIGHWTRWFLGPHRDTYLGALYKNAELTPGLETNSIPDPGGENSIVMFKSCFFNGDYVHGSPTDAPLPPGAANPLYGKDQSDDVYYTVANIKGLYRDLLSYFAGHQDKLFILITTPPSREAETTAGDAANLRAIHSWLVRSWVQQYPFPNVAVFDFSTVLTSNGGSADKNDVGATTGSHHRFRNGVVEHLVGSSALLAYPSEDTHPNAAGLQKATAELLPLLNAAVHCWKRDGGCPRLMGRQ